MTAFVTRSILLFAAKALKYNTVVFATSKLGATEVYEVHLETTSLWKLFH